MGGIAHCHSGICHPKQVAMAAGEMRSPLYSERLPVTIIASLVLLLTIGIAGCLREMSFPLNKPDIVHLSPDSEAAGGEQTLSTRAWLVQAQKQLACPWPRERTALTTDQLVDDQGRPIDVYARMGKPKQHLNIIVKNFNALVHSYQAAAPGYAIDTPAPLWPGFKTVWIPIEDELKLCGRLGFAETSGKVQLADCIVLLPGIWGDNGVLRTRDLANALRDSGFHVLALELRGHGQTEACFPDVHYTFGLMETQDLLKVSEWLQDHYPSIRRTGLIGFCWGGNLAILAAWYDGCGGKHSSITPSVARHLDPVSSRSHFEAGVISFSTVLDWEEIVDGSDQPHGSLENPCYYALQEVNRDRMMFKQHPEVSGNLRRLIAYEYVQSPLTSSFPIMDCYRFLRFLPHGNLPWDDKLSSVRVPLLMVHAVNDPFTLAQTLPDMIATTKNPNVAGLMLHGGGHIGFFPYNKAYTYSLILNFFDPRLGPSPTVPRPVMLEPCKSNTSDG